MDFKNLRPYYPYIDYKKKIVEIGDGNIMPLKDYKAIRKYCREKCKECGHAKESHVGVCRYTKGTMSCQCQRNY